MRRTLTRAYQRVQGAHPRRPQSRWSWLIEILCDGLLVLAVLAVLSGLAMVIRGVVGGFDPVWFLRGLFLLVLGPALLLAWEKLVWAPSIRKISS